MRDGRGYIDWDRTREYAESIDSYVLFVAIRDCQDTLECADEEDRLSPGTVSKGGYYRDCISVFRAELKRRELR